MTSKRCKITRNDHMDMKINYKEIKNTHKEMKTTRMKH